MFGLTCSSVGCPIRRPISMLFADAVLQRLQQLNETIETVRNDLADEVTVWGATSASWL
jgi:hypothetical protein